MFTVFNGVLTKYIKEKNEQIITIPDNVSIIGEGAFSNCRTIKAVELSDSVKKIDIKAFSNCSSLEHIKLSNGLISIGDEAFYACTNLEEIVFPDTPLQIGSRAFYGCKKINKIELPKYLNEIRDEAFKVCMNLGEIKFGDDIEKIGYQAFANTRWLEIKRKENPLVIVGDILIDAYKCKGTLVLPDKISSVSEGAFNGNFKISNMILYANNYETDVRITRSDIAERIIRLINSSENSQEFLLQQLDDNELITQLAMFLALGKGSQAGKKYLSDNIEMIARTFIMNGDAENFRKILNSKYITNSNIDELINLAVEEQQIEIHSMLLEYKNNVIGFQSLSERFKL